MFDLNKIMNHNTFYPLIVAQETINAHIRSIFGIKTGFAGTIVSNFAKVYSSWLNKGYLGSIWPIELSPSSCYITLFVVRLYYYIISNHIIDKFKLNIETVTDETNEKHLTPWADILKASRIKSSPLTPYLDKELLYNNALSVDGTKITKVTGFEYSVPEVTESKLVEVIDGYKALNLWPRD